MGNSGVLLTPWAVFALIAIHESAAGFVALPFVGALMQGVRTRVFNAVYDALVRAMRDNSLIGPWVRRFLLKHRVTERNLARNTQASYRDTLIIFSY